MRYTLETSKVRFFDVFTQTYPDRQIRLEIRPGLKQVLLSTMKLHRMALSQPTVICQDTVTCYFAELSRIDHAHSHRNVTRVSVR